MSHPLAIQGGFNQAAQLLKTVSVDGTDFALLSRCDEWLITCVTGKTRKTHSLITSAVWKALMKKLRRLEQRGANAEEDDPFANALEGLSKINGKTKTYKTSRALYASVAIQLPSVASLPECSINALTNASRTNTELWVAENDVPTVLTYLNAEFEGESFDEPAPTMNTPLWIAGSKKWVMYWKDEDGNVQEKEMRVNTRCGTARKRGELLTPCSFVRAKTRARSRLKNICRQMGCGALSETDADDVSDGGSL